MTICFDNKQLSRMANISLNDGDMSEFEKLTNSLEFENKQYVKMIEKENQVISSLQIQIQENKELIQRTESDISRLDEDTMRLHKQFLHAKETLKNMKDTYNVMMDHEMALTKQLETLKIKSDGEKQFYQEQMANYSKVKDEYMKKYKSFPLAQELDKNKEILSQMQKESVEREAAIADLQQKIAEKEAILDSKIMSRMIINIAKLKLSTIQTEKEVHECLVEKTSLLEQLKEIQRIQEPQQPEEQERKGSSKFEEDNSMDFDEDVQNKTIDVDGKQIRCNEEKSDGVTNVTINNNRFDSLQRIIQEERLEGIESGPENHQQENHNSMTIESHLSSKISDNRPQSLDTSKFDQIPQITRSVFSTMNGKEPTDVACQNSTTSLKAAIKRIRTVPQFKPIQRPLPKIPIFKPFEPSKPSKEVLQKNQTITLPVSKAESLRPTVPAFTHKISLPSIRFPRLSIQGNRSTDSNVTIQGATSLSKPVQNVDTSKPSSTFDTSASSTFSVPKIPGLSIPTSNYSMSSLQSLVQQNKPKITPERINLQVPKGLSFNKSCQNQTDNSENIRLPVKEMQSFNQNYLAAPESSVRTEVTKQKDEEPEEQIEKEQSDVDFHENGFAIGDEIAQPLFKPTSFTDPLLRDKERFSTPKPSAAFGNTNQRKDPERKSFNLGSVFNHSEDGSQSPTAFSLINLGNENDNDPETPFLSFGNSSVSNSVMEEERPNSLLNLFNTPGKSTNSNPNSQLNFDLNDNEKDEESTSFFNFGKSNRNDGSFFNFGKEFSKDDESNGKEPFFKLF